MYNLFAYEKLLQKQNLQSNLQQKISKQKQRADIYRDRLVKRHHRTITKRLACISAKPVVQQNAKISQCSPIRGFRFSPKDQLQRISDSLYRNSVLDTTPIPIHRQSFRQRHKQKQISVDLRFTPKDRYDRIQDTWKAQRTVLESSWTVSNKRKHPFPSKQAKSYYKTLETLALNTSDSLAPTTYTGRDSVRNGKLKVIKTVQELKNASSAQELVILKESMPKIAGDLAVMCGLKPKSRG